MRNNPFKLGLILIITIILTLGLSLSFQSVLAVWAPPSQDPPDDNIYAPIYSTSTSQQRIGGESGLMVGGDSTGDLDILNNINVVGNTNINSNMYINGSVGIGTNNPSAPVDIAVTSETAMEFDNGDARITIHDGFGNFNIKAGVDDDNIIDDIAGGSYIRLDSNGYIGLYVDDDTAISGTFDADAGIIIDNGLVNVYRGNFNVAGHMGLGANGNIGNNYILEIEETFTANDANQLGMRVLPHYNITLPADRTYYGAYIDAEANDVIENGFNGDLIGSFSRALVRSGSTINDAIGAYGYVYSDATSPGGITDIDRAQAVYGLVVNQTMGKIDYAYGVRGIVRNDEGTVNNARGGDFQVYSNEAGGTITNADGVFVSIYENGGVGTINTAYGVRVDCNDADTCYGLRVVAGDAEVTTDWGVYVTGEDTNYFSGDVGIGLNNPGYELEVNGNIGATGFIYTASDESLKTDIYTIPNALQRVLQLEGVNFTFIETGEEGLGLIANDVEEIFPELVNTNPETGLKSLQYGNLVAPLIEAIKEQQKEIEALEQRIDELESK